MMQTLLAPGETDRLMERIQALQRFLQAADGYLPDERLVAAHTVVERAGGRLARSREHTVVALAGSTGGGKSSLFNALARLRLSPVGTRRPTTGAAYACVWGSPGAAAELLDWIGVLPRHRYLRESALDGEDESALHGLVLLDLPDFDSVERAHRVEVDRLLGLVDLVIWVVDPQKYADSLLHDRYLRQFHRYREVTVVVLNHADRLSPADVQRCLTDLRRLLDADGLGGVPAIATSAYQPEALAELHDLLRREVAARQAALRRLAGDVEAVAAGLADLVGPPVVEAAADRGMAAALTNALATAAGVPAVADGTERAYRRRAYAAMGWPRRAASTVDDLVSSSGVDDSAAVTLAVRGVAERAGQQLPEPWAAAVMAAARSRTSELPAALDRAVHNTGPNVLGSPPWWRMLGAVQWLALIVALLGLLTLPILDGPLSTTLLLGGLVAGGAIAVLAQPLVRLAARRAAARAERQLRFAVTEVGREYVVGPVREVLRRYAEAREALAAARGITPRHIR